MAWSAMAELRNAAADRCATGEVAPQIYRKVFKGERFGQGIQRQEIWTGPADDQRQLGLKRLDTPFQSAFDKAQGAGLDRES